MRKVIFILTTCIVLLLLGYTSYRGYQVWKQSHGIAMAKNYLATGDTRNASLAVQQVLHANPRNIEATRMMTELVDSGHVLQWRERVVELDPNSFKDRVALAEAAVVSRDYTLASNTLAGAAESDKKSASYHNTAGLVALMGGQSAEAEAQFSESVRLDPANPTPQLSLAVVRLHGSNTLDMAEARIALQRILADSTNATLRIQARRELITDAIRFKDFPTALSRSKDLALQTNAVFTDKLMRLDVLKITQNSEFKPTLAQYENEAATDNEKISALAQWQMNQLSPTDALTWLRTLSSATKTNQVAEVLIATCQLKLEDWQALQASLPKQNWEDPVHWWNNLEFMRHAYLARALRGQKLIEASSAEWGVAVQAASKQNSTVLQRISFQKLFEWAYEWGWGTEAEQVLWTIVNQYPDQKWAYPILRNVLLFGQRTQSLNHLMEIMYKRVPDDLAIKNNYVATSLMLGDRSSKMYRMAQELYDKDPTSPVIVATYSFSLYLQGKSPDAAKIMQKLDPKVLQFPTIALYYGLILKANGDDAGAKTYLELASKAKLWPEEQALLKKAMTP